MYVQQLFSLIVDYYPAKNRTVQVEPATSTRKLATTPQMTPLNIDDYGDI